MVARQLLTIGRTTKREESSMGTKNTLLDLSDHLFAQIERLGDESLSPEELEMEIERSKAVSCVASQIISNANTVLRAEQFRDQKLDANLTVPRMLTGDAD